MALIDHLRPGDRVFVGQGTAEPPGLVKELIEASHSIPGLTAICGFSLTSHWLDVAEGTLRVQSYLAHGPLRKLAARGLLDIIPVNYSRLEQAVLSDELHADVVLLQVSPADESGNHSFGATVDHVSLASQHARVVVAEVNSQMPAIASRHVLHGSRITEAIMVNRPLATEATTEPSIEEQRVADLVATLVPHNATVQLGIGGLASAIGHALQSHTGLQVRTGIAGDWLATLHTSGALAPNSESVIGVALGTGELYEVLGHAETIRMGPISEQTETHDDNCREPLIAINSALEVDLMGQVGAEVAGSRYVGGIGGQTDFLRTAAKSGGRGIIALTSTTQAGSSRIVPNLTGPVTSLKSDVDFIVTEWGIADVRMATLRERFDRIVEIAHPDHRQRLGLHRSSWI